MAIRTTRNMKLCWMKQLPFVGAEYTYTHIPTCTTRRYLQGEMRLASEYNILMYIVDNIYVERRLLLCSRQRCRRRRWRCCRRHRRYHHCIACSHIWYEMKSKRRANDESTSCVLCHRSQIYIPQPVASIRAERKESATHVYVRFFEKNNLHYIYNKN